MTNITIQEDNTHITLRANDTSITLATYAGSSAADVTSAISNHNDSATAHGLTANISAALSGAASPSASNPMATLGEAGYSRVGVYRPAGWGVNWRAALANAGSALATIAIVGDSISQGYNSSSHVAKSWAGLMRAALQTTYGDGGSGYIGLMNTTFQNAAIPAADQVVTTGSWVIQSTIKDGPGPYVARNFAGSNVTALFNVRGSRVDIYYLTLGGGGLFTYAIDGGSPVQVDTNGSNGIGKTSITGLSNAAHTVLLTNVTDYTNLCGVSGYHTSGVVVNNYSVDSKQSEWVANGGTYGYPGIWSGGSSYPADLVIYCYGVNDSNQSINADTYLANVQTFIQKVKPPATGNAKKTDFIFLLPHIGKFASVSYAAYTTRLRYFAETYGALFISLWPMWGNCWDDFNSVGGWSDGTSSGLSGTDNVHPGDTGHQLYYNAIYPYVT